MKTILLISLVAALSCGCTGLASVARALSKDNAFVTVQVRTIYGSGFMVRDGRPQNGNLVTADGAISSIQPDATKKPK